MLGFPSRRILGFAYATVRSFSVVALIGVLSALTGCWDGTSTNTNIPATSELVSIAVSPPDVSLASGATQQLSATGIYGDGSKRDISANVAWSSSDTTVATISESGMVTGVSAGSITITAADGGFAGATTLTVTGAHLLSLGVTPASLSIALGTTVNLKATGVYSDNSFHDVTDSVSWSSGTPAVATVSGVGLATGSGVGMTRITAALSGVTSPAVSLKVTDATLLSIAVTPAVVALAKGTQQQLTAIGTYSDRSTQDLSSTVAWSSSAPTVATIDNESGTQGLVKATAVGTASITATLHGVTSSAVKVTVSAATLVEIAVTPPAPSLALGLSLQFRATGLYSDHSAQDVTGIVTWTSSAMSVATISNGLGVSGLLSSHAAGATNIMATLGTVSSAPVAVAVTAATLVSIGVTPAAPSIALGTGEQFTATGIYTDHSSQNLTAQVSWVSASGAVASISNATGSNGLATSLTAGSTTITAVMGSVSSSPVTLTVTTATLVSIAVTPSAPSIALGTRRQFTATGTYTDHSTQNLTTSVSWASSSGSVASISNAVGSRGLATSLTTGSTAITATSGGIPSTPVTLTVTGAVLASIAVTPAAPSIALGTQQQFVATGTYTDHSTQDLTTLVTWVSDTPTVATISNVSGSIGMATSALVGNTQIIATSQSVPSMPVTLTVTAATLVSIAVTPATQSIGQGTTLQFTATGTYSDNTTQDLTTSGAISWASSDTAVASISNAAGSNGLATAGITGTTSISATDGNIPGSTPLTVTVRSWALTGSLSNARYFHTATLLGNGTVVVAGGLDSSNLRLASAEIYQPKTAHWTLTGSLNTARYIHTSTPLPNGTALVVGGLDAGSNVLSSAEIYDPVTGAWTFASNSNDARYLHSATLLSNGTVLVAGGFDSIYGAPARTEIYDSSSGIWTYTGGLNTPRISHTATLLSNGTVLVAGGMDRNGNAFANAELYDPGTGVWTVTGNLNHPRYYRTATLLPDGTVLVAGGQDGGINTAPSSAEIYDPNTGAWSVTGNLNAGRYYHTATLLSDGTVLVAGYSASSEDYNPITGIWTLAGNMNNPRARHTATRLPNGSVLVEAGYGSGPIASAEIY